MLFKKILYVFQKSKHGIEMTYYGLRQGGYDFILLKSLHGPIFISRAHYSRYFQQYLVFTVALVDY